MCGLNCKHSKVDDKERYDKIKDKLIKDLVNDFKKMFPETKNRELNDLNYRLNLFNNNDLKLLTSQII